LEISVQFKLPREEMTPSSITVGTPVATLSVPDAVPPPLFGLPRVDDGVMASLLPKKSRKARLIQTQTETPQSPPASTAPSAGSGSGEATAAQQVDVTPFSMALPLRISKNSIGAIPSWI